MIKLLLLASVSLALCCRQPDETVAGNSMKQQDSLMPELFTLAYAERILGEPAHLTDNSKSVTADARLQHYTYKANREEKIKEKTGAVYLLFEDYNTVASAHKKYNFIMEANKSHGIHQLDDLGDEAYFHTDSVNFYFIMVRTGNRVFNMKVNKITKFTSLEQFNLVAKKITEAISRRGTVESK